MRQRMDEKEKEMRRLREEKQQIQHRADAEMELLKTQNKNEIRKTREETGRQMTKRHETRLQ